MILQALYQLALSEGLAEDLDYQMIPVGRLIALGGGRVSLIPRMEPPAGGKGRSKAMPMRIPRQEGRTANDKAYFLVDKTEYVFGWDPCGKQKPAKLENRHRLFRAEVLKALADQHPGSAEQQALKAMLMFLDLPESERIAPLVEELGPTPSEAARKELASMLFAFVFTPAGPDPIHLLPGLQIHWRARREPDSAAERQFCLVTGEHCVPATVHPAIRGVPGGNTSGAALVSFNSPAFESYGFSGGGNAPIGREASETYAAGLNRLLASAPVHPDGTRLSRRNLRLSEDTVALFWNADQGADLDWLLELDGVDPDCVRLVLESPQTGRPAPIQDPSRFCTLLLSGAQGRSIVRNFLESSTRDVAQAVRNFLDDTAIEKPFGKGTGTYPLWISMRSLAALGKTENLPANLAAEVYLAAVQDRPLPHFVLSAAVRRNRAEGPGKEGFAARCALIRASLIRHEHPSRKEIPVSLDPSRPESAYQLGRLLAVLDKCQQDALGSVNATLTDRYYGAASSTPATVFPTLLRNNRHHLAKVRKEKPGWAITHEGAIQEILDGLDDFPRVLHLRDQGLFALGFHHQRQALFTKKTTSSANA
jgi:CRISPR-associated protein Csd1